MPFVTVIGMHPLTSGDLLASVESGLKSVVCEIEELDLVGKEDHVSVIMVPGLSYVNRRQRNIKVTTSGLKNLPKRTPKVLKRIAEETGKVLHRHFPDYYVASVVEELFDYKTKPFWDNG